MLLVRQTRSFEHIMNFLLPHTHITATRIRKIPFRFYEQRTKVAHGSRAEQNAGRKLLANGSSLGMMTKGFLSPTSCALIESQESHFSVTILSQYGQGMRHHVRVEEIETDSTELSNSTIFILPSPSVLAYANWILFAGLPSNGPACCFSGSFCARLY